MDRLLTDATGQKVMAGGTQRIDYRWGESLIRQFAGQIVDGVLITGPIAEMVMPWQTSVCRRFNSSKMRASSSISVQSRQQACLPAMLTLTPGITN